MTPPARLHLLLLALLAASLAAPLGAADGGQVTADKASYRGGAKQSGDVVAFFLTDGFDANQESGSAVLSIDIRADRLEALQIEQRFLVGPEVNGATQPVADPRFDNNAPATRTVLEHAKASLTGQQDDFQVHIVPADAGSAVAFSAITDAGQFQSYEAIMMDAGDFGAPGPLDEDRRGAEDPEFWGIRIDNPLVVHDDQASQFQAAFTGNLVIEILGGTLEAHGRDGRATLESGVWTTPVDGGLLPPTVAHGQRIVLLRIFLEGATVQVGFQGATTDAKWASPALTSVQGGDSTLEGATGQVTTGNEVVVLEDERYVLAGGNTLLLKPTASNLALDVQPTPATVGGQPSLGGQSSTALAVAAVLALLAAVGLGVLRRSTTAPDLRQVEVALEGQRYARAARLAKRILRQRPGLEDAVLGRAIALSKGGRAGAAITEIHDHLAKHRASDGSLQYVLGLALLDLGRVAEAKVALAEAVRVTPALQADVVARLGPQGPSESPPMTLREVHGYA